MELWEEHLVSLPFKGLDVMDESPLFEWEWISDPLDCPPDERCSPELMVGTMIPLEGNHRPFRVGDESVSISASNFKCYNIRY